MEFSLLHCMLLIDLKYMNCFRIEKITTNKCASIFCEHILN